MEEVYDMRWYDAGKWRSRARERQPITAVFEEARKVNLCRVAIAEGYHAISTDRTRLAKGVPNPQPLGIFLLNF